MTPNDVIESIPELKTLSEVEKYTLENELSLLISSASKLMSIKEQNSEILKEISELESDVEDLKNRIFPTIYLGQAKHHSTKEPYIIARCPWRKGKNDYAHLRVYVGKTSNFKEGLKDPEVLKIAQNKIRLKIRQLFQLNNPS